MAGQNIDRRENKTECREKKAELGSRQPATENTIHVENEVMPWPHGNT